MSLLLDLLGDKIGNLKTYIDYLFDQGSISSVSGIDTVRVVPWKTWNNQWAWYAIKYNHAGGKTPTFAIDKTGHYGLVANEIAAVWAQEADTDAWTQMDNVAIGASDLTFNKATVFPSGAVYIAHWPIYPFSRVTRKVQEWSLNAYVSETPSTTNKVLGYSTARANGDGRTAPVLPFYGFKLTNATGGTKNKAILTTFNHPSETMSAFAFEGLINWLLAGSVEAEFLLDYFTFYCYPCLNPQGVYGGYFRSCPQDATKDHNRYWDVTGTLECIDAYKIAMNTDTSGVIDAGVDFHSSADADTVYGDVYDNTDANHIAFQVALAALDAGYDHRNMTTAGMLQNLWWLNYSPKLAVAIAQGGINTRGIADWQTYGANIGKAITQVLAQGRFTTGSAVGSISLNGSTDRIDWPAIWNPAGSPLTTSVWVNGDVDDTTNDYILCIHDAGDAQYGLVFNLITSTKPDFIRHGTTDYLWYSAVVTPKNQWNHLLVTSDGGLVSGSVSFYLNKVLQTTSFTNGSGAETAHIGSLSIGGRIYSDTRNFDGKIAQPALWNRVLTSTEIADLALGIAPDVAAPSGLQFYYKGNTPSLVATQPISTGTADGTTFVSGVGNGPPIIYG